jgi:CMP-N-acetylneuraminic acid synthetase
MDKLTSWDIDTQEDFDFCELMFKRLLAKNDN